MHFSFERDMGLSLWNIGFRGERIIYELTPQEALAQYCEYLLLMIKHGVCSS